MSWTPVAGGKLNRLPEILRLLKAGSWASCFVRQDPVLDQLQIVCKNQKPPRRNIFMTIGRKTRARLQIRIHYFTDPDPK